VAYHPYLSNMLGQKLKIEIKAVDEPQYIVSLGAAILAKQNWTLKPIEDVQVAVISE